MLTSSSSITSLGRIWTTAPVTVSLGALPALNLWLFKPRSFFEDTPTLGFSLSMIGSILILHVTDYSGLKSLSDSRSLKNSPPRQRQRWPLKGRSPRKTCASMVYWCPSSEDPKTVPPQEVVRVLWPCCEASRAPSERGKFASGCIRLKLMPFVPTVFYVCVRPLRQLWLPLLFSIYINFCSLWATEQQSWNLQQSCDRPLALGYAAVMDNKSGM